MVASEVKSSCQLVATFFFFFFFFLVSPYQTIEIYKSGSAQPPLISTTSSAAGHKGNSCHLYRFLPEESDKNLAATLVLFKLHLAYKLTHDNS